MTEITWIEAGKELPSDNEIYLVTYEDHHCITKILGKATYMRHCDLVWYEADGDGWKLWDEAHGRMIPYPYKVVAWMPVPSTYWTDIVGEEDDEE